MIVRSTNYRLQEVPASAAVLPGFGGNEGLAREPLTELEGTIFPEALTKRFPGGVSQRAGSLGRPWAVGVRP